MEKDSAKLKGKSRMRQKGLKFPHQDLSKELLNIDGRGGFGFYSSILVKAPDKNHEIPKWITTVLPSPDKRLSSVNSTKHGGRENGKKGSLRLQIGRAHV